MQVLKNCDELFDMAEDFNAVVYSKNREREVDTSVFSFVPSTGLFEVLAESGKQYVKTFGTYSMMKMNWIYLSQSTYYLLLLV